MLTAKPQLNLRNARDYFREHLSVGDYYSANQQRPGEWFGQGADQLGLKGGVKEADFLRLCEGLHPTTGEKLTQRMNSSRTNQDGHEVANRRVFYDFTLSPPKSVSVVGLYQDDRILEVHNRAVRKAMTELEKFAETRVRKGGQKTERVTGNVVGAAFRHDTSRELDPHLHTHCVVFNATKDSTEDRWKALEVQSMYRAQRFVENYYFHELAKGLRGLGYEIENEARAFRIKGVPESVVNRFSKRHQEIDQETQKRIKSDNWQGNIKDMREQVARDIRKRKIKDSCASRLRPLWEKQMTNAEASALKELKPIHPQAAQKSDVAGIVAWADEYLFERRSVVKDYELMAAALGRGRGEDFDLAALQTAINQREYVREEGSRKLTSREVLRDEFIVVVAAHDGRGRHGALNHGYQPAPALSLEQKTAVDKILRSRDFIMLFRGGAGTGKSFTLKEVERGLVAAKHPVVVLAPQRQQVGDLQKDGLPAETLARFLASPQLPYGAVVILDEAGQVGGRQLRELVRHVKASDGRLILSGDTRQHGAVAASDALRAIEKHSGLKPVELRQIRRQDPKLGKVAKERGAIRRYRAAVKAAAKGKTVESFDRLEALGSIRECDPRERRDALADEYLAATARHERALVVAQTREEVRTVNEIIRQRLQTAGLLDSGRNLTTYRLLDLGEAEKRDPRFFQQGQFAFFLRRYGRYAKGEICEVAGSNAQGVVLVKNGCPSTVSYRYASRLVVATAAEMSIAKGDRLQLKFNGRSVEGISLNNGELVTVHQVRNNGALVVDDDAGRRKTLAPAQRLFNRGYAVTSYASQGKTVDAVLLADAGNKSATDANQWYVSISRGRKRVVVFTSDKEGLRTAIQHAGERDLALDLRSKDTPMIDEGHRRALEVMERARLHHTVMAHAAQRVQRRGITL
jgi:conjugative relaxase-like TrwC/TraI family protein